MFHYSINGKIVPQNEAYIHISDLGLHRNYSIFDYCCIRQGKAVFFDDYLDRFEQAAARMLLSIPMSREVLKAHTAKLIEKNEVEEAGLKLLLTGGYSADGYHLADLANLYILVYPPVVWSPEVVQNGMKLILHEYVRYRPSIKTTHYTEGILMKKKLESLQAHDVLYHQNGYVSESSRSNFYIVDENDTIITSPTDVLPGITRKHLLTIAEKHLKLEVRPLKVEELQTAKEAFISSSTKGAIGIVQIDDIIIHDGKVGSITQQLNDLYEAKVQAYLNVK